MSRSAPAENPVVSPTSGGRTYGACFEGAVRTSVIVPISGCHYEFDGQKFGFDPVAYSEQDVEIVLVVGAEDSLPTAS